MADLSTALKLDAFDYGSEDDIILCKYITYSQINIYSPFFIGLNLKSFKKIQTNNIRISSFLVSHVHQ